MPHPSAAAARSLLPTVRTLALAALLFAVWGSALALGQSPPALTWPLTDLVAAVEDPGDLEAAAQGLRDRSDTDLFTLYTDTTGGQPITEYAQTVADANGLGVGDALYVVATADRTHGLWLGDGVIERVSLEQQDDILLDAEDRLTDGDLAGAPLVVAERLEDALTGGGLPVLPILAILGLGAAGLGLGYAWRRRGRTAEASPADGTVARGEPVEVSSAELLELDEQVRNATNELGFVEAMYGTEAVRPYAEAVEKARAELIAAFELRQRLDDAEPEDPNTERTMLAELAAHVSSARQVLVAQRDELSRLRDVERDAPRLVPALEAQLATLEQRLPEAGSQRARLEASYAPGNWEPVRGNRTEAEKRVASARASLSEASEALAAGDRSRAAVELVEATQALTEASALLDALDTATRRLSDAQSQLAGEMAGAAADVQTAAQALAADPSPAGEARLAEARALLERARQLGATVPPDVLAALEQANAAEAIADELVAGVRASSEERERQARMAQGAIAAAQARVSMAADFVDTRRHGVGATARVRVTEARRHLDSAIALMADEPARALAEAQRAEGLADEAYQLAQADFDGWDDRPPAPAQGGSSIFGDMGGVILGTLIGSMMSGGDRGGGPGWGGTPWGGSRGGGGGRARSPMPRFPSGGGIGGGGRARGGAGGRARGGRW